MLSISWACCLRKIFEDRYYSPLKWQLTVFCWPCYRFNVFSIFLCLQIRVTFVNEFGVEEAGIDGGGIFKDFMENITQTAFDVQYGLFKVCNSMHKFVKNEYLQFWCMYLQDDSS